MDDVMSRPVLVPAPAGHGGELVSALQGFGLPVDHSPFLELRAQRDADTREAVAGLASGRFTHVVVTAPRAVEVWASVVEESAGGEANGPDEATVPDEAGTATALPVPEDVMVIAVGHGTAAALGAHQITPALVTGDREEDLVAEVPSGEGTLLMLGSASTPAAVPSGLRAKGHAVTTVTTFRPRSVSLDTQLVRDLRRHGYGAIALGDPMIATLAGHLGIHRDIRVVTADPATTTAAEAKGLVVHGEAPEPTGRALAEAVRRALTEQTGRA